MPYQLLQFARAAPDTFCLERMTTAKALLQTHDAELEVNARKAKDIWKRDIQVAAQTGRLPPGSGLHAVMADICDMMVCETEGVEG
eukprot:10342980-Alexandrium_andersonii.AAC.1